MSRHVGIADLKDHLSDYLRQVEGGAEIVVVDRRRPIARIARIEPDALPFEIVQASRPLGARDRKAAAPARWPVSSLELLREERQRR